LNINNVLKGEFKLKRRIAAGQLVVLLVLCMFTFLSNIQPAKASGTIYIYADGSISPEDAPILTADKVTYIFADNINGSIVIQRGSIIVEGNGHAIRHAINGSALIGIDILGVNNVTIQHASVYDFRWGIHIQYSSMDVISGNTIAANEEGIALGLTSGVTISENYVTNNSAAGIYLYNSSSNSVNRNSMETNHFGLQLENSQSNVVYHNNFMDNSQAQAIVTPAGYNNTWNNSYPSSGNHWSDYNGTDICSGIYQNESGNDGIGDLQYNVTNGNIDNYPLMDPWVLDPSTGNQMNVAYSSAPTTWDPACAYDYASMELILNVYEPLIFYDEGKTDQFVPRLATDWTISPDGLQYTFAVRQNVKFHNTEPLTTEDVEYSIERLLVIDYATGPSWMFYEALFDHKATDNFTITGQQIDDAITRSNSTVTLHLVKPYPPLMQMLAQPWASILCKSWCKEIGDWPGTWNNWTMYNRPDATAIENQSTNPPGPHLNAMCGTGPYKFDYLQKSTPAKWSITKFDDYWGGWPAPDSKGFVQRITAKNIGNWAVRKSMFLEGQYDYVTVPSPSESEVLGQPHIRCYYPLESLACYAMFFTFNISTSSPYMGVPGGLPLGRLNESGIPPDFFSDINVRKGFAYAFNYSELISAGLNGEANQPATPIIPGLPFYNPDQEKYSLNLTKATECFLAAWGGQLMDNGFNLTICWPPGSSWRALACEILAANVQAINTKFHIQAQEIPWSNYSNLIRTHQMPIFMAGWLADYADPDNFALGFMESGGAFPQWQAYSNATIDSLVEEGIHNNNQTWRQQVYYTLQEYYYYNCPSVPLYQPLQRRFENDWVQGWHYNPMLSMMNYFYVQWKGEEKSSMRYPWPTFHNDASRTGYTQSPAPTTNRALWNYTTGGSISTSPAIVDDKVYFGSYDNRIYCLDASTGLQIWNYTTSNIVYCSPTVVGGKVYVGSFDGRVYCLDASTGLQIWNYTTGNQIYDSSPAVFDGKIYFGSSHNRVYCLDASSGLQIWNHTTGNEVYDVASSPTVVDGRVYVGTDEGYIYCLDAFTGTQIWWNSCHMSASSPAFADGRIYVGSGDNRTYCFAASTGEQLWNYTTGAPVYSSPAVFGGRVYVGSFDGRVYCLDAFSGGQFWNYTTGNAVHSSPAVADGKVYVGSDDHRLYCLDASTGAHIWDYLTGSSVSSSPAIADGVVFVGSYDHRVYAFGNVFKSENYVTVQAAINAAPAGAIVWVAAQIYNGSLIINKTLTLIGKKGSDSTFVGGGYGIAIIVQSTAPGTIIAGFVITNYAQGIFIDGASNCKIYDNIMTQMSNSGIAEGTSTGNNAIYNNIFRDNAIAINLTEHSTSNTIYNNTVYLNSVGLDLGSSGNTIYWNIFTDNINPVHTEPSLHNTWDNGYPDGGNYWSTHSNVDVYSGPGQNEVGGDGIADTAYNIVFAETDHYPLAKPFSEHDIGVLDVTPLKTIVGQGFTMHITSGILNYVIHSEFFTAKVYANTMVTITQKIPLEKRKSTIITFVWDTTGFARGNYTLKVCAEPVQGETDDTDNSLTSSNVTVVIPGDINADGIVELMDFFVASNAYNSQPGKTNWNPNADINDDGMVEMMDFFIMSQHYNEHEP
jgi:parallel beta-helix repeat protein